MDHPRIGVFWEDRIGCMKAAYARRKKTETRIVVWVAQHENELDTSFRKSLKSILNQMTTDSLAMVVSRYRQWSENSGGRLIVWFDLGGCKENVAYKLIIQFCDEREDRFTGRVIEHLIDKACDHWSLVVAKRTAMNSENPVAILVA